MHDKKSQNLALRRAIVLWTMLVLLVGASMYVAILSAGGSLTNAWSLATTHRPEQYSAMFFSNPAKLPSYAPAGKPQVVPFHIVNHEGLTRSYRYTIQLQLNGKLTTQTGSLQLKDGQDVQEVAKFTIPKANEVATLTIQLAGSNEQLTLRSQS